MELCGELGLSQKVKRRRMVLGRSRSGWGDRRGKVYGVVERRRFNLYAVPELSLEATVFPVSQ
jgi:hypothetical protein